MIVLDQLLWNHCYGGKLCCGLDFNPDKICKKCETLNCILKAKFFVENPQVLVINTNRSNSCNDASGMVIKTPVVIPQVLDITKFMVAALEKKSDFVTYYISRSHSFHWIFRFWWSLRIIYILQWWLYRHTHQLQKY